MKFSVLMANYNNGEYIKSAIESVLSQTYNDFELVIVDDASSDNSLDIIKEYLDDQRVKLIKHDKNLGCGATKRDCAQNADGDIFGILDPDDILDKEALKIVVEHYKEYPDCESVYANHYECDKNLNVVRISEWVGETSIKDSNLRVPRASHFFTFKKNIYFKTPGFNIDQKKAVDKDIIYKLEEFTPLSFINKPLYYYRMHDRGISLGKNAQEASAYDIMAKYEAYKRRLDTDISNLSQSEIKKLLFKGSLKFLLSKNIRGSIFLLRRFFYEL